MKLPRTANFLNGTWLHKHRETILQAYSEGRTFRQIAALLAPFAEKENRKMSPQIVFNYLKRHPLEEETSKKVIVQEIIVKEVIIKK